MGDPTDATQPVDAELLASLSSMELRARAMVEGYYSGHHRSHFRGASIEFADHRAYAHGDELRHLDWRLYGRTDRFFVKQYEAETNLIIHLLLDTSGSMGFPERGVTKLACATYLAAGLAYLAWRQRDAVGLITFDTRVGRQLPALTRRGHLQQVFDALEGARAGGETSLADALTEVGASLRRRGLIVLLSDLLDDVGALLRALGLLRSRGHDLIVLQVLDRGEVELDLRGPVVVEDLESGERLTTDADEVSARYREALQAHVEAIRDGCAARGIDHQLMITDRPLGPALVGYLARRRRRVR